MEGNYLTKTFDEALVLPDKLTEAEKRGMIGIQTFISFWFVFSLLRWMCGISASCQLPVDEDLIYIFESVCVVLVGIVARGPC